MTPVPWKFVPWHVEEGPSAVRSPAGDIVCTTASDDDAKLIAAAPDLLAATVLRTYEVEAADEKEAEAKSCDTTCDHEEDENEETMSVVRQDKNGPGI